MSAPEIDPSLVTIETVERLAAKAHEALREGRTGDVAFLLASITEETTRRTCSAVKSLPVSDEIAQQARVRVRRHLEILGEVNLSKAAERQPEVVGAAMNEHWDGTVTGLARTAKAVREKTHGGLTSTLAAIRAECERRGVTYPRSTHSGWRS